MNFKQQLQNKIDIVNNNLDKILEIKYPDIIYKAARYSIFAGGKRLRPVLMLSACESIGGNIEKVIPFSSAIEMIHTYSLIHDDLPAMDNDDLRRGMPTCHKKYGEDIAILAGDFLLNKAFEIMINSANESFDKNMIKAMKIISNLSGADGMIGGQVIDVISEGKDIDEKTLMYIHKNKTAALIKASLLAGAVIGGADESNLKLFNDIGESMGIAFQIKDDILDITSTSEELGKPVKSDEKNKKNTYVSLFGMDKAENDYKMLSDNVLNMIEKLNVNGSFLLEYYKNIVQRKN